MTAICRALGAAAILLGMSAGTAAQAQEASPYGEIPFEMYELDNGLRVILSPDPTATAVSVNLWYDVGSRHERPGRSGFAHLFEHLMFQGSANIESGEYTQYIQRAGGSFNATVNEDRTIYFQTMPPDRYNLALWLESDRLRSLQVTQENMSREVEVVKEERRMRIDNQPYGPSRLDAMYYLAYNEETCFPYAHSPIGSMDDLDAAELADVRSFHDMYYRPNNVTLALVGNFDEAEARELIEFYFGDIPRGPEPPSVECTEPFAHLPLHRVIEDSNARLPAYWSSYGAVEVGHPDSYALGILASILGQGESSRLHRRLVIDEQLALGAGSFDALRRDPGLFVVQATANQGVDAEQLGAVIDEEIERIQRDGVTAEELEKAKNRTRASAIFGRQSVMGQASALQWFNLFYGDPGAMAAAMERTMAVTAADVQRVAQQYLTPEHRAVIITVPASPPDA